MGNYLNFRYFIILPLLCGLWLSSCNESLPDAQPFEGQDQVEPKTKLSPQVFPEKTDRPEPIKELSSESSNACSEIFQKFANPSKYLVSSKYIRNNLTEIKDLGASGKSGAVPAIVKSKNDGQQRFFKIFPGIDGDLQSEQIEADMSFLEILHTCELAHITTHENLPPNIKASKFFVNLYDVGFLDSLKPFSGNEDIAGKKFYPFLLAEAVDGLPMTKLATDKKESERLLGFSVHNSPPMVLESILLQILIAIKNAHSYKGIVHNDLHTGNIILSRNEHADFAIHFKNKKNEVGGPIDQNY